MIQKVVIEPEDFKKVFDFILNTKVKVHKADEAAEVRDILLNRCKLFDVKEEVPNG